MLKTAAAERARLDKERNDLEEQLQEVKKKYMNLCLALSVIKMFICFTVK